MPNALFLHPNFAFNKKNVILPRLVAVCNPAFGIKREFGASPKLSRSREFRLRRLKSLATVCFDGKASRSGASRKTCKAFR